MSRGIDYMKAERQIRAEDRRRAVGFARAVRGPINCPFVGCAETFSNVFRLIDHIEDSHKPAFEASMRARNADEARP